jgi:hypothetical protein
MRASPWHTPLQGRKGMLLGESAHQEKVVAMRSRTTRRLAIAALAVPRRGVAVATPGVGISATEVGNGTFSA